MMTFSPLTSRPSTKLRHLQQKSLRFSALSSVEGIIYTGPPTEPPTLLEHLKQHQDVERVKRREAYEAKQAAEIQELLETPQVEMAGKPITGRAVLGLIKALQDHKFKTYKAHQFAFTKLLQKAFPFLTPSFKFVGLNDDIFPLFYHPTAPKENSPQTLVEEVVTKLANFGFLEVKSESLPIGGEFFTKHYYALTAKGEAEAAK